VTEYPSHLNTLEGRQSWSSSSIGAVEGGALSLGVRQWRSSVLGTEMDTAMSRPFAAMVEKGPCRRRMLSL